MLLCHHHAMSENFAGPFDGKKPLRFVNLRPTRVNASEDRHIVYQDLRYLGFLHVVLSKFLPYAALIEFDDFVLEEVLDSNIYVFNEKLRGYEIFQGKAAVAYAFTKLL